MNSRAPAGTIMANAQRNIHHIEVKIKLLKTLARLKIIDKENASKFFQSYKRKMDSLSKSIPYTGKTSNYKPRR